VSARPLGEEIGEGAIGFAMRVKQPEDAVETIPIVADVDEPAAVRLKALAADVTERQAAFLEEAPRYRRTTVDELGSKLDWSWGTGVSYGVYSSADAISCFENDDADAAPDQVAGGGKASRTGADDDDVSRG